MKFTVNVNDTVHVRLTDAGRARVMAWARDLGINPEHAMTDREKRGEFQIWHLMQVFGDAMYNGQPEPMFEHNDISFEVGK